MAVCDRAGGTVVSTNIIAHTSFSRLRQSVVDYRRRDGAVQRFLREAYDHGDGAAILLHNPTTDRVLLVRQWQFGAHVNPQFARDGWVVEVPAGLIDSRSPEEAIQAEALEEVGVRVQRPVLVLDCYMSPGSVTERVALFRGTYATSDLRIQGGGLAAEGEDIEVLEPTLSEAVDMIRRGDIVDAKTIILLYDLLLSQPDSARAG